MIAFGSGNENSCTMRSTTPELRLFVENSVNDRGNKDPTVKELMDIVLGYSWKPKDTHLPSGSPRSSDNTGRNHRPDTSTPLQCQLHGTGHHSSEQCRTLRALKNPSKNADKSPSTVSASSSHGASSTPSVNVTCYL